MTSVSGAWIYVQSRVWFDGEPSKARPEFVGRNVLLRFEPCITDALLGYIPTGDMALKKRHKETEMTANDYTAAAKLRQRQKQKQIG